MRRPSAFTDTVVATPVATAVGALGPAHAFEPTGQPVVDALLDGYDNGDTALVHLGDVVVNHEEVRLASVELFREGERRVIERSLRRRIGRCGSQTSFAARALGEQRG